MALIDLFPFSTLSLACKASALKVVNKLQSPTALSSQYFDEAFMEVGDFFSLKPASAAYG